MNFISLNNTWLSDLILRDYKGEDITVRAQIYEQTHLSWFKDWLPIYQDKYKLMGNTQIMVFKIIENHSISILWLDEYSRRLEIVFDIVDY